MCQFEDLQGTGESIFAGSSLIKSSWDCVITFIHFKQVVNLRIFRELESHRYISFVCCLIFNTTSFVICNRFAISGSRKLPELESNVGVCGVIVIFKDCIGYNQYNQGFRIGRKISSNHANLPHFMIRLVRIHTIAYKANCDQYYIEK